VTDDDQLGLLPELVDQGQEAHEVDVVEGASLRPSGRRVTAAAEDGEQVGHGDE